MIGHCPECGYLNGTFADGLCDVCWKEQREQETRGPGEYKNGLPIWYQPKVEGRDCFGKPIRR